MDEYCIQALPEFDGKRFQNVAKEGVKFDESEKTKENREATEKEFEPLLNWMKDKALKDKVCSWAGHTGNGRPLSQLLKLQVVTL